MRDIRSFLAQVDLDVERVVDVKAGIDTRATDQTEHKDK